MRIALPADAAQAILRYLAARPYAEVCQLVAALLAAEPLSPPAAAPCPSGEETA